MPGGRAARLDWERPTGCSGVDHCQHHRGSLGQEQLCSKPVALKVVARDFTDGSRKAMSSLCFSISGGGTSSHLDVPVRNPPLAVATVITSKTIS